MAGAKTALPGWTIGDQFQYGSILPGTTIPTYSEIFAINGETVPEPAEFGLAVVMASFGWVFWRRNRSRMVLQGRW